MFSCQITEMKLRHFQNLGTRKFQHFQDFRPTALQQEDLLNTFLDFLYFAKYFCNKYRAQCPTFGQHLEISKHVQNHIGIHPQAVINHFSIYKNLIIKK